MPRELREASIAGFLLACAAQMDAAGARFGNAHLSGHRRPELLDVDLIVVAATDPARWAAAWPATRRWSPNR